MRQLKQPFMLEFSGTPEAGKSTAILSVSNMLKTIGYKTMILKESAESLPDEFKKGTFEANLWMHFITQAGILKAQHSLVDIVLIDSKFYAWKFLKEEKCSVEQFNEFQRTCLKKINPDLFLGLLVSPKTSIKRRGGEGRLVNEQYVKEYNKFFINFFETIEVNKKLIKTDNISIVDMNNMIYSTILNELP